MTKSLFVFIALWTLCMAASAADTKETASTSSKLYNEAMQRGLLQESVIFEAHMFTPEERQALGFEIPLASLLSYQGASDAAVAGHVADGDYTAMYVLFQRKAGNGFFEEAEDIACEAAVRHEMPFLLSLIAGYHDSINNDLIEARKWTGLASRLMPPESETCTMPTT